MLSFPASQPFLSFQDFKHKPHVSALGSFWCYWLLAREDGSHGNRQPDDDTARVIEEASLRQQLPLARPHGGRGRQSDDKRKSPALIPSFVVTRYLSAGQLQEPCHTLRSTLESRVRVSDHTSPFWGLWCLKGTTLCLYLLPRLPQDGHLRTSGRHVNT